MAKRKVAVLTDTMSPDFYFPLWHRYYSKQFGTGAINVLTLPALTKSFECFELGSISAMEDFYDDNVRLAAITSSVKELLEDHDFVVHVDTDEFLVPDPLRHGSLSEYVDQLNADYVSARGFDVFQHASETKLDPNLPILVRQRHYAFALTAMNKTSITSVPLSWSRGFHFCSQPPRLDSLFLFHLKRADIDQSIRWNEYLAERILHDEFIRAYYQEPPEKVKRFLRDLSKRELDGGTSALYRNEFCQEFLNQVKFNVKSGFYESVNNSELRNVMIPDQYLGLL